MVDDSGRDDGGIVRGIRRFVLVVLMLGLLGTGADLLLLEHYEDAWQAPPLVLIAIALVMAAWLLVRASAIGWTAVLAFRIIMASFVCAGLLGVLLHGSGNREFQTEIDPTLTGWPLLVKVLTAKAPPALAPGVMVQLGLLGFLYTYRHPALTAARRASGPASTGAQR
jgi:hypothetical protein